MLLTSHIIEQANVQDFLVLSSTPFFTRNIAVLVIKFSLQQTKQSRHMRGNTLVPLGVSAPIYKNNLAIGKKVLKVLKHFLNQTCSSIVLV